MKQNNYILLPCDKNIDNKYQDIMIINIIKYFEK